MSFRGTAVDLYLTTVRRPIDLALGASGRGETSPVVLVVDRVDATVRDLAGVALRDDGLRSDATRRRAAADERARALGLRAEAEAKTERADDQADERKRAAEQRRQKANRT